MVLSKALSNEQQSEILNILKVRFEKNKNRHSEIRWVDVEQKLVSRPEKLWSLGEMENTGGEPDIVGIDSNNAEFIFIDCSAETPKGRRSLCYDRDALNARKEYKPVNSAIELASEIGIEILNEHEYRELQKFGNFDTKTSSWIQTPDEIRRLGGALFCDRRYNHVFVYHNGAESYYGVRGFRGLLRV